MGNKRQGRAHDPLWYKDAIIYQLHVRSYCDSNADGIGDFPGLTSKLDYLQDLGVTALWVMPFYPSPLKDDGYDIADYYEINPIYGTLEEFKTFLDAAHERGLRVITELVINHTSDQHAWFQKSRKAMQRLVAQAPSSATPHANADAGTLRQAGAPVEPSTGGGARATGHADDLYRDFYVWTHDPTRYKEVRIIFKDFEPSNWTWDPLAQAYYWHRFFSHQPDLNFDNPRVHEEILRIIDYWCDMGVDGFRLDAIPYLYEREGTSGESLPETHAFIKKLRAHVDEKYGDRVFLAEANQWPEESVTYFGQGKGDECHMAFHFPVMPRLFMAVRMEDRVPVVDILEQTPPLPETAQWAVFLRNHDELTLEMVTDEERDYMYRVYAHESKARINLGIRRRLAPLLGNDRKKIELLNLLLLSLPGTPVLYYGDEIGMGDNIYLGDRNGVRTPMHWSPDKNAGFSRASPQALQLPIIIDPEYHYEAINVETQQRNPHSLLWWTKRVLALRKKWRAFGRGLIEFLHPSNRKVLAFLRRLEDETVLVVANLSRFPQPVELDLKQFCGLRPRELFGRTKFPVISDTPYLLTLSPHAAFWLSIQPEQKRIDAPRGPAPIIQIGSDWRECLTGAAHTPLEAALPDYLRQERWFAGRDRDIDSVALADFAEAGPGETVFAICHVHYVGAEPELYFVPLAFATGAEAQALRDSPLPRVIAELRGGVEGVLYDASVSEGFARPLLEFPTRSHRQRSRRGEFVSAQIAAPPREESTTLPAASSPISMRSDLNNTSFAFGGKRFVKVFRRIEAGLNSELEIARYLTQRGFQHVPHLVSWLDYRRDGETYDLAMTTEFVPSAVSAWQAALDALGRYFDRVRALESSPALPDGTLPGLSSKPLAADAAEVLGTHGELTRLLGQRTAELHIALASDGENKDFAPEPFTPFYQRSLYQSMRNRAVEVLGRLKDQLPELPENARALVGDIPAWQKKIVARLSAVYREPMDAQRTRIHGDFHLAQVLYTGKDFCFVDFEGDWSRPLSERRIKRTPLRDVVNMVRSFHYAAEKALANEQERGHFLATRAAEAEQWVRFWSRWISALYLRGYLDAMSGTSLLPKSAAHLDVLFGVLLLDRTLIELNHELANRPGSAHIPLRGLNELLASP